MNKWYINEIAITAALLIILVFFWNPWYLWMPEQFVYLIVAGFTILVALYAGLVLREKPADEREEKLREKAGRAGFLAGVFVLSIGVIYQVIFAKVDPFLLLALAVMVLVKIFAFKKSE